MNRNRNGHNHKPESPSLGPCCVCETTEGVRNIIALHQKSPIRGHGWGCFQCGLPADGATAVTCDDCLHKPLRFACRGYPAKDGRIPIEELDGTHEHYYAKHPEEWWFNDSPDAGHPDCICSVCRLQIGEDDNPLRMWSDKSKDALEARFHPDCFEKVSSYFI